MELRRNLRGPAPDITGQPSSGGFAPRPVRREQIPCYGRRGLVIGFGLEKGGSTMVNKVRWGARGAAGIATQKVIPAMQQGEWSVVSGIASRDRAKAEAAAGSLGIPKAYGSYEEILRDPEI